MNTVQDICKFLETFAPTGLAEDWDNVGLIVGDSANKAAKVMTCLTVTPQSAAEAIENEVDLIVSHHPLPFRPMKRITTSETPSRLLWNLIRGGVSIYSPHTGFDSASSGINQSLAERLGLTDVNPLIPAPDPEIGPGSGRYGQLANAVSLAEFTEMIKSSFELPAVKVVSGGDGLNCMVQHVAVACGSGGSFLDKAVAANCDTFVTGETTFHTCLEAEAQGVSLVLPGHFASERFAVEMLAGKLAEAFPDCEVWASRKESDPVKVV